MGWGRFAHPFVILPPRGGDVGGADREGAGSASTKLKPQTPPDRGLHSKTATHPHAWRHH
jgi:hypothetical protein